MAAIAARLLLRSRPVVFAPFNSPPVTGHPVALSTVHKVVSMPLPRKSSKKSNVFVPLLAAGALAFP